MVTKIQKWGNSLALRIPKAFAKEANLLNDSLVEITMVDKQIVITSFETPTYTLDDLLEGVTKKNIHSEVSTNSVVGKEVW